MKKEMKQKSLEIISLKELAEFDDRVRELEKELDTRLDYGFKFSKVPNFDLYHVRIRIYSYYTHLGFGTAGVIFEDTTIQSIMDDVINMNRERLVEYNKKMEHQHTG